MKKPTMYFIQSPLPKLQQQGFTLIELLVVILIVGALAAIALPNLLKQAEKARESEAKNNLGTINRMQQVHNFETGEFATDMEELNLQLTVGELDGVNYETGFYTYSVNGTPSGNAVYHDATANPSYRFDIKNAASAVFKSSGTFTSVICLANEISAVPTINDANSCTNGDILR